MIPLPLARTVMTCLCLIMLGSGVMAIGAETNVPKPINTVCPVTGKPIDATIPPVVITMGKGEKARKVVIGVADAAAAERVKASPETYAPAALANKQVVDKQP
jgi:hypothetical protein